MRPFSARMARIATVLVCALLVIAIFVVSFLIYCRLTESPLVSRLRAIDLPDWIEVDLIKFDGASRRGTSLEELNNIVVHYIGNPGTSAANNRNYFNNPDSTVSAHFIVGLEGEIIQCIPLWEVSSASNHRNRDTISIEVCHPDATGVFNEKTYTSLIRLVAWLCNETGLSPDAVIRHYDVTGKACPLWFVEDEAAWAAFKADISNATIKE